MAARRRSLKELAGDPQFISGVYNYCDRWCERCPLTSRCFVYATEPQEDVREPALRDITNRAFWERLGEIFREAHEMLDEMLRERGIELAPLDPEAEQELARWHDEAWSHPCAVAAGEFVERPAPVFAAEDSAATVGDPGLADRRVRRSKALAAPDPLTVLRLDHEHSLTQGL